MHTLIADIEADGLLDTISNIWQISTICLETGERASYNRGTLEEGFEALRAADRLVFHNGIGYDLPAIKKVEGIVIDPAVVIDTMVLSKLYKPTLAGGHSLAAWGERLHHAPDKVEHEDWSQWSPEMEHRCATDTEITLGVFQKLEWMLTKQAKPVAIEHRVAAAAAEMVARGFTLDIERARAVMSDKMEHQDDLRRRLKERFGPIYVAAGAPKAFRKPPNKSHWAHGIIDAGDLFTPIKLQEFNPGSREQIGKRLKMEFGWEPSSFTPTGMPEISEDTLKNTPYKEAHWIADYLETDKAIGQINSPVKKDGTGGGWLHHVKDDNRVHPGFNPTGANTHRSSCAGPNLQQVSGARDMRECWIPQQGMTLVGVDASGLELRCLAHYLAKYDGGAYAKVLVEGDIHSYVQDIIEFHSRTYTKNVEYGLIYGAGDAKLGQMQRKDMVEAGVEIPKISNTKMGKALRAKLFSGVVGLGDLTKKVRAKAERDGRIKAIDGRTLWVRSEHSALNLLLQSCGAIIVKTAWALMEEELSGLRYGWDYATVIQVHDEWQIECRPEVADEVGQGVVRCIELAGENLGFRCPLTGEYKIGSSWADTH